MPPETIASFFDASRFVVFAPKNHVMLKKPGKKPVKLEMVKVFEKTISTNVLEEGTLLTQLSESTFYDNIFLGSLSASSQFSQLSFVDFSSVLRKSLKNREGETIFTIDLELGDTKIQNFRL